jgi:toxin FitB
MYLLDTNVVSDTRKEAKPVLDWIRSVNSASLFLSVITIGEIVRGIEMKRRRDPKAADALSNWLADMRFDVRDRILPVTEEIAELWGNISAMRTREDADGLIAATAIVHGLTLVTRNVEDFVDTGVKIVNPWDAV